MYVALALYDPSRPAPNGSFWVWRSARLDRGLLDRLYYDIASSCRPNDPNRLEPSAVVGGFARLTPQWVFAYRFGNGGRDAHGRLGRFVMVVAAVRLDEARDNDLSLLLTCAPVVDVLNRAPLSRPVSAPAELEFEITAPGVNVESSLVARVIAEQRLELSGSNALAQAGSVCGSLPADRHWTCRVQVDGQGSAAVIECPSAPTVGDAASQHAVQPAASPPIDRHRSTIDRSATLWHHRWTKYAAAVTVLVLLGVAAYAYTTLRSTNAEPAPPKKPTPKEPKKDDLPATDDEAKKALPSTHSVGPIPRSTQGGQPADE